LEQRRGPGEASSRTRRDRLPRDYAGRQASDGCRRAEADHSGQAQ